MWLLREKFMVGSHVEDNGLNFTNILKTPIQCKKSLSRGMQGFHGHQCCLIWYKKKKMTRIVIELIMDMIIFQHIRKGNVSLAFIARDF